MQPAQDFQSTTGGGVAAQVEGREVAVGKLGFLQTRKVTGLDPLAAEAELLQRLGQTVMFVAIDGEAAGIVSVADPIKESTPEAIRSLHALGLRIVMLTGENQHTAEAMAKQSGLDEEEAGVDTRDKHARVYALARAGKFVAMEGDGIIGAPALAGTHVGIAMGTGTDVATESAGVILMKSDLRGGDSPQPRTYGQHPAKPVLRLHLQPLGIPTISAGKRLA